MPIGVCRGVQMDNFANISTTHATFAMKTVWVQEGAQALPLVSRGKSWQILRGS
jgi:hypothetical protein